MIGYFGVMVPAVSDAEKIRGIRKNTKWHKNYF
jgi:hypothetical protein